MLDRLSNQAIRKRTASTGTTVIRHRLLSFYQISPTEPSKFILIVHGFSSPGIFYGANSIYIRSGSRRILINPGFLRFNPLLRLFWFLLCIANIRAPPRRNLLAEVITINRVISSNSTTAVEIAFLIFFRGAYTLILYSRSQQGQKSFKIDAS